MLKCETDQFKITSTASFAKSRHRCKTNDQRCKTNSLDFKRTKRLTFLSVPFSAVCWGIFGFFLIYGGAIHLSDSMYIFNKSCNRLLLQKIAKNISWVLCHFKMKKGCFCSRNTASCTAALVFSIDQEIIYAKYLRSKGITKTLIKDVKKIFV